MSLLFNMLSRLVIAFLPRSKHLLNTQISKHNQSIKVLWWSNAHLFFPFDFMYALLNYLHTKYFLFLTLKLKIIFRDTDEIVKRLSCLYFGKTRFLVTAILYTFLDEKSILYMIVILQWQKMCHFFYSGLLFYKCFWLWCSLHLPLEAHLSMNPQPAKIAQSCPTLCTIPWMRHARPPCPSPAPGIYSDSYQSCLWCHPAISSSVIPFSSRRQSLPASASFPLSKLFSWAGPKYWSFSCSVSPSNENWSPLG